ncbi:MAG: hypothetical protein IJ511_04585 [Bacteroides sp.]|nr:hypothetical protein [Bacteroides sp.]
MRILTLLTLSLLLSGCSPKQQNIDFQQVLEIAQQRANQNKSLSEDTLLYQALEHYRALEPKDSARLSQATILTAIHHWWKGEKAEAYNLLESIAETDKNALKTLMSLSNRDYNYEACHRYLLRIMRDETERKSFENQHALAIMLFYLNRPEECIRLFGNLTQYIRTSSDTTNYWRQALRNYADILSDYGNQEKAIELQKQYLHHFIEKKDSMEVAFAHASLARYYLLQDNLKEAEHQIALAEANTNDKFLNNLPMQSYMQLLRSILHYAKEKRIYIMEWANFVNQLGENAYIRQAITDVKEENNRLLNERNLKLTIKQQQTRLTMIYVASGLLIIIAVLTFIIQRKKRQAQEKEEELETLRKLVTESQQHTEKQKDDRFFKSVMLQQLGVIRMAAANPTAANQELLKRMTAITNKEVVVDALLDWQVLYQTIDYIYDGFHRHLLERYADVLNEKEIQLCCLLRANFSTKEIALVTQQSVRTVYQRKTVVRQKLGMEEKENIAEALEK